MEDWHEFKLNELGKLGRGKSKHRPRNEPSLYGGEYPFIQTGDIKSANFYVLQYSQTYNEKGLAQSKLWEKGTLCITIAANIAETAILGIDACFPDSVIGFIADKNKSDVRFIKYYFDILKIHLQSISQGTTQDNLSQEKLLKFSFIVPKNVEDQKRIASMLSTYDDLIENNNERIKLLEEIVQDLYKEWFVRMRFPGYKQAKFVKGVPQEWKITTLANEVFFKMGQSPKSEFYNEIGDGLPFHQGVGTYGFRFPTHKTFCSIKGKIADKDDILFSVRAPVGRLNIADRKIIIGRGLAALKHKNGLNNYLLYLLKNEFSKEDIIGNGAIFNSVSKEELMRYKIFDVGILAEKFDALISPICSQLSILIKQNTLLRETRDRLLPRLISGKLQIKLQSDFNEAESTELHQIIDTAGKSKEDIKVNSNFFFKRRVLAAHIIDRLKDEPTFGHVKLMKLMYLCEHLAEIETVSHYHRHAAGPYDNRMIRSIDSQLKKAQWFECKKTGNKYQYTALPKKEEYKNWFTKYYSDKEVDIENLLQLFGKEKTEKAEMVATLYEAWRDLKDKKQLPTEQAIIYEILNNWHESKQRISEERWLKCLQWMKEKNWIT